jgi:hypothetical protein
MKVCGDSVEDAGSAARSANMMAVRLRYVPRTGTAKRRTRDTIVIVTFVAVIGLPGVPVVLRDSFPRAWCAVGLPSCPTAHAD